MKLSPRLQAEKEYVEHALAGKVVCVKCSADLHSYAAVCSADLSDPCPGFLVIEEARRIFNEQWKREHQ